jgi:mRNA interferase RelE/StbE
MELIFSKSSIKFLKKLSKKDVERVQSKLLTLLNSIEQSGLVPSGELDIKSMEGEWQGFLRMRVGKIRVIFSVDIEQDEIQIYEIAFRGSIYK